jgi:hypothetical protein
MHLGRFELNEWDILWYTLLTLCTIHSETNQEFVDAIKQCFSTIDVKKTQSLVKRGKTPEEALDIHNEIKIITSDDSTFALWSEVLASHSQEELLDPKTNPLKKFKDNKTWKPEKEGVHNREFFKWL